MIPVPRARAPGSRNRKRLTISSFTTIPARCWLRPITTLLPQPISNRLSTAKALLCFTTSVYVLPSPPDVPPPPAAAAAASSLSAAAAAAAAVVAAAAATCAAADALAAALASPRLPLMWHSIFALASVTAAAAAATAAVAGLSCRVPLGGGARRLRHLRRLCVVLLFGRSFVRLFWESARACVRAAGRD